MRLTSAFLLSVLLLCFFYPSSTEAGRDLETDHYVRLHKVRVRYAEAQKQRQVARLGFSKARYERAVRLCSSSAMSREEYDQASAAYQMNTSLLQEMEARIEGAQVLLELCRARVAEGKEMPIFPLSSGGIDSPLAF